MHVETSFHKPATGSHLLLAPEDTVVKPANYFPSLSAYVLRAPRQHLLGFEAHPRAITFPSVRDLLRPSTRTHPLPATPFQCPRPRTTTLGWGAAAPFLPLRWPDCTLSRLRAEEYDWPVTQSIAIPEPSSRTIPTLDRTLVARWSLGCATTLGSRRSCPGWAAAHFTWILIFFTSLACYPGATPYWHWNTAGLCRDRWGLSSPYHVSLLVRLTGGIATQTRRYHARMLIHPSSSACATPRPEVFAHTQVRDPRESAAACSWHALGTPSSWPPRL